MSKKIFIFIGCVLFCLTGIVSAACDWWNTGTDWAPQAGSSDWSDPANWSNGVPTYNESDGCGLWARLGLNMVGPDIDEDVNTCRMSVAVWCAENDNIDVNILSGLVNCGWGLGIAVNGTLGLGEGEYGRGYGKVNMYGGEIIAPRGRTNIDGQYQFGALGVGGGDWHSPGDAQNGCPDPQYPQGYLNNYGELYVYDGNITVPSVEVTDGVINLWGGKLTVNTTTPNLHFFDIYREVHSPSPGGPIYQVPSNKGINLGGGTLSIIGDRTADASFLAFIADGRIIAYGYDTWSGPNCLFLSRGDVVADYNGTYTNFTGVSQPNRAWNPQPVDKADQLEYDPPPMLSWGAGDDANDINGHVLYFDIDYAAVDSCSAYLTTTTEPNYTFGSALLPGVTYYWKVNEVNDTNVWAGQVWQFKMKGGTAINPVPASGSTPVFDINALQISWTQGAFVADTDGHRIYFGTDYASVLAAGPGTAKIDRGLRSSPLYKLKDLASDYALAANRTYYWRIDEINGVDTWPGEVWNFIMSSYAVVDAFDDYASGDDFSAVWKTGLEKKSTCLPDCYTVPGGAVTLGAGNMQFAYDNAGASYCPWSEAKMDYNGFPVDWRVNGVFPAKSLALTYTGNIANAVDPDYDRMFVAIEDSAGDFGIMLNPDTVAEARQFAATWQIKLTDLNSPNVDLDDINAMYIGFGERCSWDGQTFGGTGTVAFDDIRLYLSSCTPGSVVGDFNDDCFVNVYDLDIMASDWLDTDTTLTYATVTPPLDPNLMLRYNFDETSGTTVTDSSGKAQNGTVENITPTTWESTGGYDGSGCINFDWGRRIDVNVPPSALSFFTGGTGVTFSLWIKADKAHPPTNDQWGQPFGVRGNVGQYGDCFEIKLPTPAATPSATFIVWQNSSTSQTCAVGSAMSWNDFADRWNHYALTYDDTNNFMRIYLNGAQIGENNNVTITMPAAPAEVFVGVRAPTWSWWNGKVDDFRVYNYPLDANEVAFIATKGTGSITLPLVEVTNIVSSSPQRVNFRDFAMMAQQWLLEQP